MAFNEVNMTKPEILQLRYKRSLFRISIIYYLPISTSEHFFALLYRQFLSKLHRSIQNIHYNRCIWSLSLPISEKYYNSLRNILFYTHKNDWSRELNRCGARYWRVISTGGEEEIPNGSLPLHYVIPSKILDSEYNRLANSFRNGRAAIWVFSLGDVSLVRMAELLPTITDSAQENIMLENVRRCDPMTQPPHLLELSKCLPSNQDVQISYTKFRDLFTPDSTRHFLVKLIKPKLAHFARPF